VLVAACVVVVLEVFGPKAERRVEHAHERVGHWVGHLLGVLLLGLVDLLVFTPIAFVMWVLRYDPLAPGVARDTASFWHAHGARALPSRPYADERRVHPPVPSASAHPRAAVATMVGVVTLLLPPTRCRLGTTR
jgi:hypothetical protein